MTRRCSHCSNNGHNSRTCPTRGGGGGLRLFGVRLTEGVGAMKKSASMGCLSSTALSSASPSGDLPGTGAAHASGYASDDPAHASCSSSRSERKKGTPWTEEEHRMFLLGLKKLGKGDWRGIAKNFVVSRTPTQMASHAQKYFIRQCNTSRRKRRSSLFDMVPEMPMQQAPIHEQLVPCPPKDPESTDDLPSLHLSLQQRPEVIKPPKTNHITQLRESIPYNNNTPIALVPTFYPAFIPVTLPLWPANLPTAVKDAEMGETYEIVKPTPVVQNDPENVDEVSMFKLSICEGSVSRMEPSTLSLKLQRTTSSRQSAFHSNSSISGPDLNQSSGNPIHAL